MKRQDIPKKCNMLEILKIIILTCQVTGSNTAFVDKYQKECQKELIDCVDKISPNDATGSWGTSRAVECIRNRK